MVTLPPWLVGLCLVYVIAITFLFVLFGTEQLQRRREARQLVDDPVEQAYADTPQQQEIARLRALAEADAAGAAFVTPGTPRADAFLAELFPRSKDAPKERP